MFDQNVHPKIRKVIISLAHSSTFFYYYGIRTSFREYPDEKSQDGKEQKRTMGVYPVKGNAIRIIYDKDFIESLTDEELKGVLIHEFLHLIMFTFGRKEGRGHKLWNVATDYANNDMIMSMKVNGESLTLPKESLIMEQLTQKGYTGAVLAEAIYDYLYENAEKISINASDNFDDHDGMEEIDFDDLDIRDKAALRDAVEGAMAQTKQAGKSAGSVEDFIENLKNPKIPWQTILKNIVLATTHNRKGHPYASWRRPHRRLLPLQDKLHRTINLNVAVDTSGSISDNEISAFFTEMEAIIQACKGSVNLLQWDTKVQSCAPYRSGDWRKIKVVGRGGTDVQDLFDYLHTNKMYKDLTIVFTDGQFDNNVDLKGCHPVWVTTDTEVSLGKNIKLEI